MFEMQGVLHAIEQCCYRLIMESEYSNRKWTSEIKQSVVNYARDNDNNFCVCVGGSDIENKDNGEWLYDITIIKMYNANMIEYVDTVIESEWGDITQVLEDFQKVMQSNARNKIVICQDSMLSADDIFFVLQTQLNLYSDFLLSDSVTVLCFNNEHKNILQRTIRKSQL